MSHTNYAPAEWTARREFTRIVNDICATQGIALEWSSQDWVARLHKNGVSRFIYGYTFPVNNAGVTCVLRDKAATYGILSGAGVPAVPHTLLRLPADRTTAIRAVLDLAPLPLVIKPNMGESGGFDVIRCETRAELTAALQDLATRHQNLAVCPYIHIAREFRVVMLAGEPLLVFSKTPAAHEWRHNVRLGATPALVTDAARTTELTALARSAMQATSAELAAVDIAETPEGYKIMEINGGISLAHIAEVSPDLRRAARAVYSAILARIFTAY